MQDERKDQLGDDVNTGGKGEGKQQVDGSDLVEQDQQKDPHEEEQGGGDNCDHDEGNKDNKLFQNIKCGDLMEYLHPILHFL